MPATSGAVPEGIFADGVAVGVGRCEREAAAKFWPCAAVTFDPVTTGRLSMNVTPNGFDQAPQT